MKKYNNKVKSYGHKNFSIIKCKPCNHLIPITFLHISGHGFSVYLMHIQFINADSIGMFAKKLYNFRTFKLYHNGRYS